MSRMIRERFSKPADEFAERFVASVDADRNLVEEDVRGSIAHARMLCKKKILSPGETRRIIKALRQILRDWEKGKFDLDVSLGFLAIRGRSFVAHFPEP